jgi:hypothetical protein
MSKNVIYFSLLMKKHDASYYAMLYTALSSLKPYQNDSFDVVVMYTCLDKEFDINTYVHNDKYNIVKDFPFVSFIESDYQETDVHMHRWHNFSKIFEMGYDVAFYLDCDVIFFENPIFHFERYSEKNVMYAKYKGYFPLWEKVLGREGIASGQMILPRSVFSELKPNLYDRIISTRKILEKKAHKVLRKDDAEWFCSLSEQYSAFETLQNENVNIKNLEHEDIVYIGGDAKGMINADWIQLKNEHGIISVENCNSKIFHYLGGNAFVLVPGGLHTPEMAKQYNEFERDWKINLVSKSEDVINHLTNYIESCKTEEELYTIAYEMINLSRNIYDESLNEKYREDLLNILPGSQRETFQWP